MDPIHLHMSQVKRIHKLESDRRSKNRIRRPLFAQRFLHIVPLIRPLRKYQISDPHSPSAAAGASDLEHLHSTPAASAAFPLLLRARRPGPPSPLSKRHLIFAGALAHLPLFGRSWDMMTSSPMLDSPRM